MKIEFVCNLCGNHFGHTIPFRYKFKEKFLWGVKCDQCKLVSIWPRPTDDEIKQMYEDDYFVGTDKQTHHMEVSYMDILTRGDYKEGLIELKKYCQQGNILDIGCATGNFLYVLKNNGYKVKGIELSTFAAEYGNEHFGVGIINKPFDSKLLNKELSENEFDIILMGDVLEHFINPTEAIQLTYKILKKGGVALVQVPGTLNLISSKIAFILYRLLGTQKTMYIPPYHLTEFSTKTVRKMFEHAGFTNIKIEQHIKHPSTITLRGNAIENFGKKYLQYLNYYLTKWFQVPGDRIHIEAYK